MIAINPNLRELKPLSRYMEKRVRMNGRLRLANEQTTTGNNLKTVTLSFTPFSEQTLEIYFKGIRQLDGWTLKGKVVTFTAAKSGELKFVDDTTWIDTSLKWLQIDIANLVHPDDYNNAAYGTDRREGHNVATWCEPVVIAQPGIGFCRLSDDRKSLMYSSFYGMFGRDSVTYAIRAANGQLSDYRCIDIRVRNPNFVPEMRMGVITSSAETFRVGGTVLTGTAEGYNVVGYVSTGGTIELPNKTTETAMREVVLIFQGKDEDGEWRQFSEFFEPDQYSFEFDQENEDYVFLDAGEAGAYGFEQANYVRFNCKQATSSTIGFTIKFADRTIFTGTLNGRGALEPEAEDISRSLSNDAAVAFDSNPNNDSNTAVWEASGSFDETGLKTVSKYSNTAAEVHEVEVQFTGAIVTFPKAYWNPGIGIETMTDYDVSKTYRGSFHTTGGAQNVSISDSETTLFERELLWDSNDPFAKQFIMPKITFKYENDWSFK